MNCQPDYEVLPPSVRSDLRSRAFVDAVWRKLLCLDLTSVLIYRFDTVPESALYYLAEAFDVLGYKGWILAETEEEKRELLKIAFDLHRYAGTRYAIRRALEWLGFDVDFEIVENPGSYYDGLTFDYTGDLTYSGALLGQFSVRASGGPVLNLNQVAWIVKLIETWKPLSRKLFDLYLNDIPVFRNLRLYDGTWFYDGSVDYSGYIIEEVPDPI